MNRPIRNTALVALLGFGAAAATSASAFEIQQTGQLHSGSYLDSYYSGGYAGNTYTSGPLTGNIQYGPGPNDGVAFSSNANVQSSGTSAGKFENLPTNDLDHNTQVLYFSALGGATTVDTINFAKGFNGISFDYSLSGNNSLYAHTVDIWSGLNGTGTLLGTISLTASAAPTACSNRLDTYCSWSFASESNIIDAKSITFGVANSAASVNTEYFGVTITPVPEPSSAWLLLGGMAGLLGFVGRRRRAGGTTAA
jgi:hypothetical protein